MEQFAGGLPGELIPDPARRERYEEIVRDTVKELYGNARYWEFFRGFNEESVHDFISEYASRKAWYILNGQRMVRKREQELFQFRDMAEKCFWEIQQKKLFNLQAEWRAGLTELPGITVTRDFICWEKAISKCPFLDPVTLGDLSLYMDYLESGTWCEKSWVYNWQDYDTYRNAPDAMPAWYKYYDSKRGTDYLLLLEDKKGIEEKKYIQAWKAVNNPPNGHGINEEEFMSGNGPALQVNYESLNFFIRTFENRHLYEYFLATENKPAESEYNEGDLQDAIRLLSKAGQKIRLPDESDWRTAIIKGAKTFKVYKIIAHLPFIFDEYLFRLKNGITLSDPGDQSIYEEYIAFTLLYKEQVEAGKRFLG